MGPTTKTIDGGSIPLHEDRMRNTLYKELAACIEARQNCDKANNAEWLDRWQARIEYITENFMPSGSGFDRGTKFDFDSSHAERLVFDTNFHHMDEHGYYTGWTRHAVI